MSPHRRQPPCTTLVSPPSRRGASPLDPPSPSSKPSAPEGTPLASGRLPRSPPPPTLPTHPGLRGHHRTAAGRHRRHAGPSRGDPTVTPRTAPRPNGFLPNNGRLPAFYIPHLGHRALARFIRKCPGDPTMAEGTMGGTGAETDLRQYPPEAQPPQANPLRAGEGEPNRRAPPRVAPGPPLRVRNHLPPAPPLQSTAPGTGASPPTPHDTAPHGQSDRTSSTPPARASSTVLGSCWEILDLIARPIGRG